MLFADFHKALERVEFRSHCNHAVSRSSCVTGRRSVWTHSRVRSGVFFFKRIQPGKDLGSGDPGIAIGRLRYYPSSMSVLTCKLPSALDGRLADLAKRRGVPKSVLVREAIEAKIAEEAAAPRRPPCSR